MILVIEANAFTREIPMRGPVFKVLAQRAYEGSTRVVPTVGLEQTEAVWRHAVEPIKLRMPSDLCWA